MLVLRYCHRYVIFFKDYIPIGGNKTKQKHFNIILFNYPSIALHGIQRHLNDEWFSCVEQNV